MPLLKGCPPQSVQVNLNPQLFAVAAHVSERYFVELPAGLKSRWPSSTRVLLLAGRNI